ncbi:MAG: ComF family protein [Elusimicrobia bacterium]|nr:ComF family protein [Elusimicrobiota bacterium]
MPPLPALGKALLRLVFPQTCAHCQEDLPGSRTDPLCEACAKLLAPAEPPFCSRCGDRVGASRTHCRPCSKRLFACGLIRPAFYYGGAAASLVHAFKYRGRGDAARFCGRRMAEGLGRSPELRGFDRVVPVPLHPSRLRERGYNQALLLAEEVASASGKPVSDLLVRRVATKPQWNLARGQRSANLAGAFMARDGLPAGAKVLLIDDVCTTSATLEECAKALKAAGAASVHALVFARQSLKGER